MPKYIEELSIGDFFNLNNNIYVITTDFKKNGNRLCCDLMSGSLVWMNPTDIIDVKDIYYLDTNNNMCPIKERKKEI